MARTFGLDYDIRTRAAVPEGPKHVHRFDRFRHPIAFLELPNIPPLTGSCQDGNHEISLDSPAYAGPAIASYDGIRIHGDRPFRTHAVPSNKKILNEVSLVSHLKFLLSLPIALAVAQGLRVESTPYATVTDERLQRPEAGDWLLYRRTYDGSGFSPRQQINTGGGGKDWPPEALSPRTKLLYVPANNNICAFLPKGAVPKPDARGLYVGYEVESIFGSVRTSTGAADHLGELQAWT